MSLDDASAALIMSLPGDMPRHVLNEFRRGWRMTEVLAGVEQERIAASQPERTWCDGLGQMTLSIHPDAFHFWGQRLGYGCWADKKFRREFARDNPAVRVRSRPRKTAIRISGFKQGAGSREHGASNGGSSGSVLPAPSSQLV